MTNKRVNEIDLLRFVAALAVVFYHYSFRGHAADAMSVMSYPILAPASKYGYLGVELFFMISGFVILMTAANGSLRRFAISRIVRLYPAFWACCTVTFLVTLAIGAPRYSASVGQYLTNMTMLSGFIGVPPLDYVYWSLFVELQFYVFVAMVLIIGQIHRAQMFLILWLIATLATEIWPVEALRLLVLTEYSAFFIAGAAFFMIWSKGLSATRISIVSVSWLLATFQSLQGLGEIEKHYHIAMNSYIVAGIITSFFVVMMLVSLKWTGFFGRSRWMVAGALTYPLYLLHQNIGYMVFNVVYPGVNRHLLFWAAILAALISAYAVHLFVEKRFSSPMKTGLNKLVDFTQRTAMRLSGRDESRRQA